MDRTNAIEIGQQAQGDSLAAGVDDALRGYAAAREGTRTGIVQSKLLDLVETPEQAAAVMRQAVRILEENLARLPAHAEKACGAGCAWCCRQRVDVSPLEALAIAGFVRTELPAEIAAAVRQRLRENASCVKSLTQAEHARRAISCAFLDERNYCRIHPVRPLACVGWHSFSRERCEQFYQIGGCTEGGVEADMATNLEARGFHAGLADAVRALGRDGNLYELHAGVSRALEEASAARDWADGNESFAGCTPGVVSGDVVLRHRHADGATTLVTWTNDGCFSVETVPPSKGATAERACAEQIP